ncbi:MAG: hypothetical protein AB4058_12475 [Microcystaceae cyanobacterium]
MMRQLLTLFMILTLGLTTVSCSSPSPTSSQGNVSNTVSRPSNPSQVSSGRYPVQQAEYNDLDGTYTLMLLNTPPGTPSVFKTDKLQMARLTDEQIEQGETTFLEANGNEGTLYLTEDFKIEYVHSVTETQTNPQTGRPETVIVQQRSSFWTPFAGALAGQAIGSMLFSPRYYVPPVYQSGGVMTGVGGYGRTYDDAVSSYRSRNNALPPVETNRQNLRTTGNLRRSPSTSATKSPTNPNTNKATGSGYGSSNLKNSGNSRPTRSRSNSGFGSKSRSLSRPRSGGRRR